MSRAAARRLRAGAAALGLALAGCTATHVHIFGGFPYDPVHDCLGAATAVDVIDGPDPSPCPTIRCWAAPSGDVFVTDQACDGPPDFLESTAGACAGALAAYKRGALGRCPGVLDGGVEGGD